MTCQKIPYSTRQEALADAKFIKVQQKFKSKKYGNKKKCGMKLYAYECYFCDKWHLSTKKQRKR